MTPIRQIDEGLTYEYLIHGIMTIIVGIILMVSIHPICAPVVLAGIIMTMSKTGIEIDINGKRIRKYVSWIVYKTGMWYDLSTIKIVELRYNTQHSKLTRPLYLDKGDTTAKTFDLILVSDNDEEVLLNSFTKPGLAFKTIEALKGISQYEVINHVEGMLKTQQSRRRR